MIDLVLVRHAKSDWGSPGLPDHDRPLNGRGMRDAPVLAGRLAGSGFRPDVILASTALRARTTAEAFAAELGVAVDLDPELYGAPADVLWQQAIGSGAASVMVVAHDPGMSDLASRLSDDGIAQMPTCAVARFTWDDGTDAAAGLPAARWTFDSPGAR